MPPAGSLQGSSATGRRYPFERSSARRGCYLTYEPHSVLVSHCLVSYTKEHGMNAREALQQELAARLESLARNEELARTGKPRARFAYAAAATKQRARIARLKRELGEIS